MYQISSWFTSKTYYSNYSKWVLILVNSELAIARPYSEFFMDTKGPIFLCWFKMFWNSLTLSNPEFCWFFNEKHSLLWETLAKIFINFLLYHFTLVNPRDKIIWRERERVKPIWASYCMFGTRKFYNKSRKYQREIKFI